MKKKLEIKRETIRVLTPDLMAMAVGGAQQHQPIVLGPTEVLHNGFIMKDSVIVRTSTR